jgi:ketosteroid isomerase-like protein
MSREYVEAVRTAFEAWNRGDREGWLAACHPEVEWRSAVLLQVEGAGAVHRGPAEVGRFWDEWHALWDLEVAVSELRDLGDSVLALARIKTRGKSSGAETERPVGYVFQFEDGLIRRARAYLSADEALKAVGLSE